MSALSVDNIQISHFLFVRLPRDVFSWTLDIRACHCNKYTQHDHKHSNGITRSFCCLKAFFCLFVFLLCFARKLHSCFGWRKESGYYHWKAVCVCVEGEGGGGKGADGARESQRD